jgi:hypothetical protein
MSRFGYDVKSVCVWGVRNNHRLDWDFMSFLTLFFSAELVLHSLLHFGIHPHTLLIHVANVYREREVKTTKYS